MKPLVGLTKISKASALALLAAVSCLALGQDFPTLKGDANRSGHNTSPTTSGPGVANLIWFKPQQGFNQYTRYAMSPEATKAGTWTGLGPNTSQDEATMVLFPNATGDATQDSLSGQAAWTTANANNPSTAVDYYFAYSIASTTDVNQPTVQLNPGDTLSTFSWKVEPVSGGNGVADNYALYAWIPLGPTIDPNTNTTVFPQRFYVFDIQYGKNSHFTDVVDTSSGAQGWFRLGNGGFPTLRTFQYDGTDPIVITLYNTVPRDRQTGQLTEAATNTPPIEINPKTCVYANAVMAVPEIGFYHASPIVSAFDPSTGSGSTHVVRCLNTITSSTSSGTTTQFTLGTAFSENVANGALNWSWSPVEAGGAVVNMDTNSAGVTSAAPWTSSSTAIGQKGTSYLVAPITNTLSSAQQVTYAPTMLDGSYLIQVWIPGSGGGYTFATATTYEIDEGTGAGGTATQVTVNQDAVGGWVTLGTRRFNHNNAQGLPLTVNVLNYSAQAGDAGRTAFTDAIRFIGGENLGIESTPVQVTAGVVHPGGGGPVSTAVTLVAAEDGRVYCLDSAGDGHGGTTMYWAYPTLPNVASDPNQVTGEDGPGPTAQMPTGFNLSSAVVAHLPDGSDRLYIASNNGRVYCIDMAGRGDGTTRRLWSYPDDYPSLAQNSNLGPFAGSLAYFTDATVGPTIVVPAKQGRVYALDAVGGALKTTSVRWSFPGTGSTKDALQSFSSAPRNPGDVSWANAANAQLLDGVFATTTPDLAGGGTGGSQYLEATNSSLKVPPGTVILGIQVRVVRNRTTADSGYYIHDSEVKLIKAGVVQNAANRADTQSDWAVSPNTETKTYGGQGDLWGNTWTATDLNDPGFGVAIAVQGNGNSSSSSPNIPTAQIDYVEIRIFYQAQDTVGPIISTPTVAFGNVYFGTTIKPGDDRGRFFAVNQDTGAKLWEFNGTTAWSANGTTFTNADDFASGSVAVPASELNQYGTGQVDSIVVANENLWISSLNAQTGALQWSTDELQSGVKGNLAYSPLSVFDNSATGVYANAPNVLVPTADGRFVGLMALTDTWVTNQQAIAAGGPYTFGARNRFGSRRAWEYDATSNLTASLAVGRNYMYGADENGFFYAFGNGSSTTSTNAPGNPGQVENDKGYQNLAEDFREAKIKFISKTLYDQLRKEEYPNNPSPTTFDVIDTYSGPENTAGHYFEWGETIYAVAYKYPCLPDSPTAQRPVVNFRFSQNGQSLGPNNFPVTSSKFQDSDASVPTASSGDGVRLNGFAVMQLALNGGLPPGLATAQINISTTATSSPSNRHFQAVFLDKDLSSHQFGIANPLAVAMKFSGGTADPMYSIGWTANGSTAQNQENGSAYTGGAEHEDLLTAPFGTFTHNQSKTFDVYIADRSLMTQLRGPNHGLDNVRVERADLAWQGGYGMVQKPIPANLFPGFEDLPINTPNDSLDYPDIRREQVNVIKDPNGTAENPLFKLGGVTLTPPIIGSDPTTRTLVGTDFAFTLAVPQYQPPNAFAGWNDSAGSPIDSGYRGLYYVYVDNQNNQAFTLDNNRRPAYRSFWLSNGVSKDEHFMVNTPVVDLGSLPQSAGKSNASDFSAWSGPYSDMFKSFNVLNQGNVNLLDMRLAKQYGQSGGLNDWDIDPTNANSLAWLDARVDGWSDIDKTFGLTPQVILQKPRPGDRSPTQLLTNPVRRTNGNLGVTAGPLITGTNAPTPAAPRVTVTIPFGFPVGTYSQTMRVVEDANENEALDYNGSNQPIETYSDPTFTLTFKVRETPLTGRPAAHQPKLIDNNITNTETYLHANSQPAAIRDSSGNLVTVFASTRPSFNAAQPTSASTDNAQSLYGASLAGGQPTATGPGQNPLRDLDFFTPKDTTRWFSEDLGPYPTTAPSQLFVATGLSGYTINPNAAVKYNSPAFPSSVFNPFTGASTNTPYLVFEGEAQVSSSNATITNSLVMIAKATLGGNGQITLADPTPLRDDLSSPTVMTGQRKLRPSVLQFGSNATVFYATPGSGHGQMFYATYSGANWTANTSIGLPASFDTVGAPSPSARIYNGQSTAAVSNGDHLIELTFPGKLRGRPYGEIFYGRMKCDSNGIPQMNGSTLFIDLPEITNEILSPTAQPDMFQAAGVDWDRQAGLHLFVNGTDVIAANPVQVDPQTGVIALNSSVTGGTVYLDPTSGTVRFTGTPPSSKTLVQLTYTPRFLRISSGTRATLSPTLLYDNRNVGDLSYWATPSGGAVPPNTAITQSRYVVTYGALAAGSGEATRPFMSTFRFGVQLPSAVATNSDGTIVGCQVNGSTGDFQVDPVNGKLYFTDADEGKVITVTYTGVDATGNQIPSQTTGQYTIAMIPETKETAVPVEEAINEAQMTAFLDPFNYSPPYSTTNPARPGLIWLFWTSTRNGTPDVIFQTIAPRLTPVASSK